jgi:hypothetical protein
MRVNWSEEEEWENIDLDGWKMLEEVLWEVKVKR